MVFTTRRVAIVTGASRGIGRSIAEALSRDGFAVVINYAKSAEEAKSVVESIRAQQGEAVAIQADLTTKAGAESLIRDSIAKFGSLDVLVHNAASVTLKPTFAEYTEEDYDLFGAQQKATFFLFAEAAKHIRDDGRIVFISTVATHTYLQGASAYSGFKAAADTYVRHLSRELATKRVTVNTVSPGYTETAMFPEKLRDVAIAATPLGRLGRPEDIASVVAFVASEKAAWITGQNLFADGGVVSLQ
eukprot:TRINITY_DN14447_c0_g1_i1.p2 TRINITY_DN14447_c0_g1~~TRINITY_DN14447_c0_g1_i1.p2  ORF type:complete len:246 (+),score=62.87 TRINITY_DN14447_c0_g1_i1:102-839(+)